jgi:hypothetical protein
MNEKIKNLGYGFLGIVILAGALFVQEKVRAYGDCSAYGMWATYDYSSGGCKCISGYVFGKDYFGQISCISGDTVCRDKYGYSSRYNSLSGSCECDYGYVLGKDSIGRTQCISKNQACQNQYGLNARSSYGDNCECDYGYTFGKDYSGKIQCISEDQMCKDKYGVMSRYNSLSDKCECAYGFVISDGKCTDGNVVCQAKHGSYSIYEDLSSSCKCASGYTFDNLNQCVKKQNNVYFTLKELNTDERKAIIRSDYDYRYYLISYNFGCFPTSFGRYLNHQIVVNLGTDLNLDMWDKIVLQDDNETCDITRVERADSSTTLEPKASEVNPFISQPQIIIYPSPSPIYKTPIPQLSEIKKVFPTENIIANKSATTSLDTIIEKNNTQKKPSFFARIFGSIKNFFSIIFK